MRALDAAPFSRLTRFKSGHRWSPVFPTEQGRRTGELHL